VQLGGFKACSSCATTIGKIFVQIIGATWKKNLWEAVSDSQSSPGGQCAALANVTGTWNFDKATVEIDRRKIYDWNGQILRPHPSCKTNNTFA
jgi:hypothetical protein